MKTITTILSFILLIYIFTGCALKPIITTQKGVSPPINTKVKKYVGDVIFEQFEYKQNEVVFLKYNYNKSYILGNININSTELLLCYSDNTEKQYCTSKKTYFEIFGPYDIVCFGGIDKVNNNFTKVRVPKIMFGSWSSLDNPVEFNKSTIYTNNGASGFKYQLIYAGLDGNTIKITYREFINNMARPAFYQSVNYTINRKNYLKKLDLNL